MTGKRLKLATVATLVLGFILALVLGIVIVINVWGGNTIIQRSLVNNGRETLSASTRSFFNPLFTVDASIMETMVNQLLTQESIVYVAVRDAEGKIIVKAGDELVQDEQGKRDLSARALAQQDIVQHKSGGYLMLHGPIAAGSRSIGTLEITFDQAPQQATLASVQRQIISVIAIVSVFAILAVFLLTRYATAPLRALIAVAEEIGRGELDVSVPVRGVEETASLGMALEQMRSELQQLYASLEEQVAARTAELTESYEEQERLHQQVLDAQQQMIHELSTPVIPMMDTPQGGIIVMPLVGHMDTARAKDTMRALLAGIREHRARVVILDITGVPIVDSGVAAHLDKTIQAASLKGARTIVTGISDTVAEAVVDLGIDWSNIETLSDLQTGLVTALNSLGVKLSGASGD